MMDFSALLGGNQIFTGAVGGGLVLGLLNYLRPIPTRIAEFVTDRWTTLIAVHSGDGYTFTAVSQWLVEQNPAKWAKRYRLREVYSRKLGTYETRTSTHYGTYLFFWKGKLCKARVWKEDNAPAGSDGGKTRDFAEIRVFSAKTASTADFLAEVAALRNQYTDDVAKVRKLKEAHCASDELELDGEATPPVLKAGQLESIEEDIRRFRAAEKWYAERGVPYRRGYLFFGPPGTGKTSLIRYLAMKFQANVYYAGAAELMSGTFSSAISSVPAGSLVVIEDIDRIFAQAQLGEKKDSKMSLVDMAGYLNSTDGIASPRGIVFVITANDITAIDAAVLRPGRIDVNVHLSEVDDHQAAEIHARFFGVRSEEFAKAAAGKRLTPAQCQEILLRTQSPEEALRLLI